MFFEIVIGFLSIGLFVLPYAYYKWHYFIILIIILHYVYYYPCITGEKIGTKRMNNLTKICKSIIDRMETQACPALEP